MVIKIERLFLMYICKEMGEREEEKNLKNIIK